MLDIKIRQIKIYNSSNLRLKGGADVLWSLFNGDAPLLNNKNLSPPPYTPHAPNIYVDIDVLSKASSLSTLICMYEFSLRCFDEMNRKTIQRDVRL